ncbi:MAG: porin [Variovorax sp.]
MKKTLIAVAVLASAGAALAQSSVTLFGVVDVSIVRSTGSISKKFQVTNNGIGANQVGFRGVEDLGGGMYAGFWLEAWVNPDNGTGLATNTNNQTTGTAAAPAGTQGLTFNRRSTVSLGSSWGEIRIGRDYTPSYWNIANFDPWGNLGIAKSLTTEVAITGPTGVRASNSISYLYGGQGFNATSRGGSDGLAVALMAYTGENNSNTPNSQDGNGYSGRLGYQAGPWNAAIATGRTKYLAGNIRQTNLGASYDFGVAKLTGHYARDKNGAVSARGFLVGASAPVFTVGQVRASYSEYKTDAAGGPKVKKLGLGYVHNLSKRTALFATVAHSSNSGGASFSMYGSTTAVNGSSNAYEGGIRHSF